MFKGSLYQQKQVLYSKKYKGQLNALANTFWLKWGEHCDIFTVLKLEQLECLRSEDTPAA